MLLNPTMPRVIQSQMSELQWLRNLVLEIRKKDGRKACCGYSSACNASSPPPQYRALCTPVLMHIGALPCGPPTSPGEDLHLPGMGARVRVSIPPLKHIVSLSFQHIGEIPMEKKCPLVAHFFFPALCY